jgi:Outer membrane receptor proteins, mostly Fe transport
MSKKIVVIILCNLLFFLSVLAGDKVRGTVKDVSGAPVSFAFVYWEGSQHAVMTDDAGSFEIQLSSEGISTLCVEYIGYNTNCQEITNLDEELTIVMQSNLELDAIEVIGFIPGTAKDRNSLFNKDNISTRELSRAACCSLAESFETNPSVDVSYSDAVTGSKQIQLLGLAGRYVQMLTENYPNFRGVSSAYGMDYIPGPWMQSIQVSKGSASVKNGYESITGQINAEYKKPHQADPLSVNLFASDAGRYEANLDGAIGLNDKLYTGLLLHYSFENERHDSNHDSFLDMPKRNQFNIMNRWHYQIPEFISQSGVKYIYDKRTSGQTSSTVHESQIEDPYRIGVRVNRGEVFTKNGYIFDQETGKSLALMLSGTYHDQESYYADKHYDIAQTNVYASLMYEASFTDKHKLSTGLSLNYDNYKPSGNIGRLYSGVQDNKETTTGVYAEYTFTPQESFSLLAGVRADYSNVYDFFITPRLHLKYTPADFANIRLSAGKGYRTPFVLPENQYLLASSRILFFDSKIEQEEAWNFGGSMAFYIPIGRRELSLTGEVYYTKFQNQAVVDLDQNAHEVHFYNLKGRSDALVVQGEASYSPITGLTLMGAYRWMDTKTNYNGVVRDKPLMSKYKAMATVSYETKFRKWQFDFTAQFNGKGRMPLPDETNPLWDRKFKPYTILLAQITRNFRNFGVYIGSENLTNFKQKNPIVGSNDPYGPDFDTTLIWGPTMERKFYIGIRYNISK